MQKNLATLIDSALNPTNFPPGVVSSHHEKSIRPDLTAVPNTTPTLNDHRREAPPAVSFAEGQSKVAEARNTPPPWNQSNRSNGQYNRRSSTPGMQTRSASPPANRGDKQQGICWDFQAGHCTRGAKCRFLHSLESQDTMPAPVMLMQQIFGASDTYEAQCRYQDLQDDLSDAKTRASQEDEVEE